MSATPTDSPMPAPRLFAAFALALCVYLGGMALLWCVGIESIYGHPTPFYALYHPALSSGLTPLLVLLVGTAICVWGARMARIHSREFFLPMLLLAVLLAFAAWQGHQIGGIPGLGTDLAALPYHGAVLLLGTGGVAAVLWTLRRGGDFEGAPGRRIVIRYLAALVVFAFAFACAVAMLRGGTEGIYQSYLRQRLEFTGDIGVASSFQELFRRYTTIQPHLSLHGRVHPPGPIVILSSFSLFLGQGALTLALCTAFTGALAVVPMYLWSAEIAGRRAGLLAASVYALVPSVVLFTATSSDILYTPFTLGTLWLFERGIRRCCPGCAFAAGIGYGCMSLLKYSLLTVGAYFGFVGLWLLARKEARKNVFMTAGLMLAALAAVHTGVYFWSHFDFVASFKIAKEYVDHDRFHENTLAPRASLLTWRLLNPLCWIYFAGIPVTLLACGSFIRSAKQEHVKPVLFALTFAVLSLLYLGAGEGERSALYVFPFLVLPAALRLDQHFGQSASSAPVAITLGFLAFQCWLTEVLFYTYW